MVTCFVLCLISFYGKHSFLKNLCGHSLRLKMKNVLLQRQYAFFSVQFLGEFIVQEHLKINSKLEDL